MGTTTKQQPGVGDTSMDEMTDAQIQQLMAGAPDEFSDPGEETEPSVPINAPAIERGAPGVPDDKVLLVNLDFVNETVFLPEGGEISARSKVQFNEGHLVTDRETADFVKSVCPYVYEESKEGEVFTHAPSGFSTRNAAGFVKFVSIYTESSVAG